MIQVVQTQPAASTRTEFPVRVRRVRRATTSVTLVELENPHGRLPAWQPGAHVTLRLPNGLERQYSLCGPRADRPRRYVVAVQLDADGRGGSAYVHSALHRGERIGLVGPSNHFPFRAEPMVQLLAAGIGVTAILPMAREAARLRLDWALTYLGRHRSDMVFRRDVMRLGPRARVLETASTGRPDVAALLAGGGGPVYACGPPGFLDDCLEQGARVGRQVHVERFRPAVDPRTLPSGAFTARRVRSGSLVHVAAGQSLLEALRESGAAIPTSCGTGVCGSCEVRVLSGAIDHRDVVLADSPQPGPGRTAPLMSCVSRAADGHLDLDL